MLLAILVFKLCLIAVHSAESNGQKAHFQVEDKSGDLKVIATKDMAKVTSQADSVQVVVKPGMADYPVVKSDKPIVHVTNGCCGWNSLSFKKSLIKKGKAYSKHQRKQKVYNEKLRARKSNRQLELGKRLPLNGKLPSNKSSLLKRFKSLTPYKKKTKENQSQKTKTSFKTLKLKEETASRKSFQPNEFGFAVSGTAGKLNMDVTTNGTKITSESGVMDVFLKRKASSAQHDNIHKHDIVHIAPELVNNDEIGLRKSQIPKKINKRTPVIPY
ncbi:uncharacterized protein LOC110232727 [Exaiptasia diaphana]|uniref:Uncharacterized protein n=1 Tax=Exaiptasia diaphana TaxID=2652724 RepID=A0A913WSV5_EXADI|nr:uncharacterized protein LOC110232727 [Exaiptasia diaphana]